MIDFRRIENLFRRPRFSELLDARILATNWEEPWHLVKSDQAALLEAELRAEIGPKHVLFNGKDDAVAVAKRQYQDDVFYALLDGRFAVVHLTYNLRPEPTANYPDTQLFDAYQDFLDDVLYPDVKSWKLTD